MTRIHVIACWLLTALSLVNAIVGQIVGRSEVVLDLRWLQFSVWLIGSLIITELVNWRKL